MKILFVDLKYDYGNPKRGMNLIGEIGYHQVFKSLGHDVVPFYYDEYLGQAHLKAKLQTDLLAFAEEQKPDLIYFILFQDQFEFSTLKKLKEKYTTMNWFGDDQWRFEIFTKKYAPYFTLNITTDYFALPKYKALGLPVVYSQWAAFNYPVEYSNLVDYKYDVSFIGANNSVRTWMIAEFKKAGINVNCFGFNWPQGSVSLDQMVEIFKTSKVNLNLSNSMTYDLRYLTHSWKNPLIALRSPKTASQMKARNFEIPYYGGFQLTDYVPTLEHYFHIGEEAICYSTLKEAIDLTKFYLQNDDLREAVRKKSHLRAVNEHTYRHRHEKILK